MSTDNRVRRALLSLRYTVQTLKLDALRQLIPGGDRATDPEAVELLELAVELDALDDAEPPDDLSASFRPPTEES